MKYAEQFREHVKKFIESMDLIDLKKKQVIAVSGGVDSMALLNILYKAYGPLFEVVHINHGTRIENEIEEKLVKKFCQKLNIKMHIFKLQMSLNEKNFEAKAREQRNTIFKRFILENYQVIEAHHIDDSFEWTMMQRLKQGKLVSTLGIPVCNNGIIRPFLSVTKKQIIKYAKKTHVEWIEDQSNQNTKYERNYWRLKLINKFGAKYPQMLKHYTYQQNELALSLNVHRASILRQKNPLFIVDHVLTGRVLTSARLDLYRAELIREIENLSKAKRGKINAVVDMIFKSVVKIRGDKKAKKFHGPYPLPGKVEAYLFGESIYLLSSDKLYLFENWNSSLQAIPSETPIGLCKFTNQNDHRYFPNLLLIKNEYQYSKSNLELPFLKEGLISLKRADIPYSFLCLSKH
jgi:tRNA(Ile)-lysidine synthase